MKAKQKISATLALLVVASVSFWVGNHVIIKGASITVLSQIKQYSSEDEPPTTGSKFYHLKRNKEYRTLRVVELEEAQAKELATYDLDKDPSRDEYLTLSFFPERSDEIWWALCSRSAVKQHPFLQGPIEDDWRLDNASRGIYKRLEADEEMVDTIIFVRKGTHLEMSDYDTIWSCESVSELKLATGKIKACRVVAFLLNK